MASHFLRKRFHLSSKELEIFWFVDIVVLWYEFLPKLFAPFGQRSQYGCVLYLNSFCIYFCVTERKHILIDLPTDEIWSIVSDFLAVLSFLAVIINANCFSWFYLKTSFIWLTESRIKSRVSLVLTRLHPILILNHFKNLAHVFFKHLEVGLSRKQWAFIIAATNDRVDD